MINWCKLVNGVFYWCRLTNGVSIDVDRCKWSHAAGEEKPADIPTTVRGRDESDK